MIFPHRVCKKTYVFLFPGVLDEHWLPLGHDPLLPCIAGCAQVKCLGLLSGC